MRRDLISRMLRALLAVWFVLTVGEPSVVHICPMHSSAAAELAAGHHAGHSTSHHSHSAGQHAHHCTCISCCVGSASSALAPSGYRLEAPALVAAFAPPTLPSDAVPLEDPPHLLPPGTGPPRV